MLETLRRFWRSVVFVLHHGVEMDAEIEDLKRRVYSLEQEKKRMLAVQRSQTRLLEKMNIVSSDGERREAVHTA